MKIPDSLDLLSKAQNLEGLSIPDPSYLGKVYGGKLGEGKDGKLEKYEKEYDKYCQWSALPKELREPKTQDKFEKKWKIPKSYSYTFRKRKDFQNRRLAYFWDWMMDSFPDVVYAMYKRAIDKSSVDARAFAELISKHIDVERPAQIIQSLAIIGVPQEKIDRLFIPKTFENIKGIIPIDE